MAKFQNKSYKIAENIVWRDIEGEVIILNIDNGEYYAMNETASAFWKIFNEEERDPVAALLEIFDAGKDQIKSDIKEILENFLEEGIISPVESRREDE